MPYQIAVPGVGVVEVPDSISVEEASRRLREQFPPSDKSIYDTASSDSRFALDMTVSQYEQYRRHKSSLPTNRLSDFASAVGAIGGEVASALWENPFKTIGSLHRAGYVGTRDLLGLVQDIAHIDAPDTYESHLKKSGQSDTEHSKFKYHQELGKDLEEFKRTMRWAGEREEVIAGAMSPDAARGFANIADPTLLIPGLGLAGKAGSVAGRATLKGVVKAGAMAEAAGARIGAAAAIPENAAARLVTAATDSVAAGEAVRGTVARGATIGFGAGLGGVSIPGATAAATVVAGGKAAGATMSALGEATRVAAGHALHGTGMLSPLEALAADAAASTGARVIGRVGAAMGLDTAGQIAWSAGGGAIEGSIIGGVLGGLAHGFDSSEMWQGVGGGFALGGVGGGVGRGVMKISGAEHAGNVRADFAHEMLMRADAEHWTNFAEGQSSKWIGNQLGITRILEASGWKVVLHGKDGAALIGDPRLRGETKYGAVAIKGETQADGTALPNTIYVNADSAGAKKNGIAHEAFHALQREGHLRELNNILVGENVGGTVIREGALSAKDFSDFANSYAKALPEGSAKRIELERALLRMEDPSLSAADRYSAKKNFLDEFGAYYMQAWAGAQGKDAFLAGRIDTVYSKLFNIVADNIANRLGLNAQRHGFNFSGGDILGGFHVNGKRVVIPALDKLVAGIVKPKNGQFEPVVTKVVIGKDLVKNRGLIKAMNLENRYVWDADDNPVRLKTPEEIRADDAQFNAQLMHALEAVPAAARNGVRAISNERGSIGADEWVFTQKTPPTAEQVDAILNSGVYSPSQRTRIETLLKNISSGNIFQIGYWKAMENGAIGVFPHTTREALPYSVHINSAKGIYFKMLDVSRVRTNFTKAMAKPENRGLYADHGEAWNAFVETYLKNLSDETAVPSAEALGGGERGQKRRNLFYEVLGTVPKKDQTLVNPAAEGYAPSRRGGSTVESFRPERMTEMVDTGDKMTFNEALTYPRSQVNFLPSFGDVETVGTAKVRTHEDGSRIIKQLTGGYRLYKKNGDLAGVFDGWDAAQEAYAGGRRAAGDKAAASDTAYVEAVHRGDMAVASKLVQDAATSSGFSIKAFHGTPTGGFISFRESPHGLFFTSKESASTGYTNRRGIWQSRGERPQIYPVFLKMENPLTIDAMGARHNNIPMLGREHRKTVFGRLPDKAVSVADAARMAFEGGHDGAIIKNVMDAADSGDKTRSTVYVVARPSQIKSSNPVTRDDGGKIIPPSQRFAAGSSDIRYLPDDQPAFYSRLNRAVEQTTQNKASGAQWKATIKNSKLGTNADEYALVGVGDLEDGKTYTKQEVLDYLKANEVVVKDVTLGAEGSMSEEMEDAMGGGGQRMPSTPEEWMAESAKFETLAQRVQKNGFTEMADRYFRLSEEANRLAEGLGKDGSTQGRPHFSTRVLLGAKEGSYREVLLTVPEDRSPLSEARGTWAIRDASGKEFMRWNAKDRAEIEAEVESRKAGYPIYRTATIHEVESPESHRIEDRRQVWRDGHSQYSSTVNPIVRLRFNERTTSDGKRMLFLEEVQAPQKGEFDKMPALFQKNWREIAFKWALRHAAENGFDSVGWTTGEQQAARGDLSKQVSRIEVRKVPGSTQVYLAAYDHAPGSDRREYGRRVIDKMVNPGELESYIGKELAAKVEAMEWTPYDHETPQGETITQDHKVLSGLDLKVGGEGLKKLYDTDFRNVVNSLPAVKKAGQKVGTSNIGLVGKVVNYTDGSGTFGREGEATLYRVKEYGDEWRVQEKAAPGEPWIQNTTSFKTRGEATDSVLQPRPDKIHSITLTPAIRESVMSGQARFLPEAPGGREVKGEAVREARRLEQVGSLAMDLASGVRGKDVFARSIEEIKESIPANERWIGEKVPGQPVRAGDGEMFLNRDLNQKTGPLNVTQESIEKAWADAINVTGPAAQRAISDLAKDGIVMKPPGEAHWKAAENLPQKDRLWYEISSEATRVVYPDFSARELEIALDTTAATSPLADPIYNARLAISILAEDVQGIPSVTPAVVPTAVKDALLGGFGAQEQRKIGSFSGTFKFLLGLSDDPPLTTNDRQVAASMGIPDSAFGEYPVLYELQSRFMNNLRDHINATAPLDPSLGPIQSHQLQALSWVQQRAEQRLRRRTDITSEQAFEGDAYASAYKLAADDLRSDGVTVGTDQQTGLPLFTKSVLSDPRVQEILSPTGREFLQSTIQTMEVANKLRDTGKAFAAAIAESNQLGIGPNIKLLEQVLARAARFLMLRTQDGKKKTPSPLSKLASVFGLATADISRVEHGVGTFEKDINPNLRIPLDEVPEKYRSAFLAILGTHFHQAAQAASRFISISANADGSSPKADTHSIWFHGKATMDGLEGLAQALTNVGHEANISQRPNGVLVDVNPKFTEEGAVAIDPHMLQIFANETASTGKATVIPRQYNSIYIEMPEYAGIIAKAKKELLNEHASKIEVATSLGRKTAKDLLRGDQGAVSAGSISVNRRAEKIKDSYRQRIDQLYASEKELKRLFKDFEKDARAAIKEAQRRIDSFKKRRQP